MYFCSLKLMLCFTIICIIFLVSYIYSNIIILDNSLDSETSKIDILSEYNLSKIKIKNKNKKIDKLYDKYNIKEFDCINDNIIIHNKFKTELLDYQTNKNLIQLELEESKKQKELELNKSFQKNIEVETKQQLIKDILKLQDDNKALKLLFKEDIKNIITDIKNGNLTNDNKKELIQMILLEIEKIKKQLQLILEAKNNSYESNKKTQLLQEKINILNKKFELYTKIFNTNDINSI